MHLDANTVNMVVTILVGILGLFIRHAIVTPKDHETAALLSHLADDFAAVVLNLAPTAPWSSLLRDVIAKLKAQLPDVNPQTLESAATAALVRLGKLQSPPATTVVPAK